MTELMQKIRRFPPLFASLSASGPPTNHVSPLSVRKALTGHWEGDYEYLHLKNHEESRGRHTFPEFRTRLKSVMIPCLRNRVTKSWHFQALGLTYRGDFAVYGFVDPESCIWFVNLYKNTGWLYKGKLSADMKLLRGAWGGSRSCGIEPFLLLLRSLRLKVSHISGTRTKSCKGAMEMDRVMW